MILRLDREDPVEVAGFVDRLTWGDIYVDGAYECCTLEDDVRQIYGQHVALWKIPKRTAIPAGTYRLDKRNSPHFGPDTLVLLDVPGYSLVEIHGGTTIEDTDGCILVGSRQDRVNGTLHGAKVAQRFGASVVAPVLDALKVKVVPALNRREKVFLQIRNAPAWYVASGVPVPKSLPYAVTTA